MTILKKKMLNTHKYDEALQFTSIKQNMSVNHSIWAIFDFERNHIGNCLLIANNSIKLP
jgi:hypothetical protein